MRLRQRHPQRWLTEFVLVPQVLTMLGRRRLRLDDMFRKLVETPHGRSEPASLIRSDRFPERPLGLGSAASAAKPRSFWGHGSAADESTFHPLAVGADKGTAEEVDASRVEGPSGRPNDVNTSMPCGKCIDDRGSNVQQSPHLASRDQDSVLPIAAGLSVSEPSRTPALSLCADAGGLANRIQTHRTYQTIVAARADGGEQVQASPDMMTPELRGEGSSRFEENIMQCRRRRARRICLASGRGAGNVRNDAAVVGSLLWETGCTDYQAAKSGYRLNLAGSTTEIGPIACEQRERT
jgi:hypothetical protein